VIFQGAPGLVSSFGKPLTFTIPIMTLGADRVWKETGSTTEYHPKVSIHPLNKSDTYDRQPSANRRVERVRLHSTKEIKRGARFTYRDDSGAVGTFRVVSVNQYNAVAGVFYADAERYQP
jgi:hypothetical protein